MELTTIPNVYGDLQILGPLPTDPDICSTAIDKLFQHSSCQRGVWLELPIATHYKLFPLLITKGFTVHHSYQGVITLQAWRKFDPITKQLLPNPTPPYGYTGIGAGAIVINKDGKVLGIKEKFDTSNYLFPPGGHVDEGENWITAAIREAYEETGVISEPLGIINIRQLQIPRYTESNNRNTTTNTSTTTDISSATTSSALPFNDYSFAPIPEWKLPINASLTNNSQENIEYARYIQSFRFGTSHLGVHVLCIAIDDTLNPDYDEISDVQWYSPEEFIERAHAHIAVMVAAAHASGQIKEAGEYARAKYIEKQQQTNQSSSSSTIPFPSSSNYIHTTHAWLASTRRNAANHNTTVSDSNANKGTTPTTPSSNVKLYPTLHTFYHSYSPTLFENITQTLSRTVNVKQGTLFGTIIPSEITKNNAIFPRTGIQKDISKYMNIRSSWVYFTIGVAVGMSITLIQPWKVRK